MGHKMFGSEQYQNQTINGSLPSLKICQALEEEGLRGQHRALQAPQGLRAPPDLCQGRQLQLPLQGGPQRDLSLS